MSLPDHTNLTVDVTNAYSFITIDIKNDSGQLFAQIRFELTDDTGKPASIFCQDDAIQRNLNDKIERLNWPGWRSSPTIHTKFSEQVLQSMQTADSVAALVKNCTQGDEYRPGNFSTISASEKWIKLEQINYMNSRSLSHKNNYSLRQLTFTIPLEPNPVNERSREKYKIGIMNAEFSDGSSANNRVCGDKVIAELERLAAE